ncbi:MAG: dTDP-4-dehydrorhamnose reductase [Solirubrobacterales bacterium]|nr:dTDP-4-dehydrorhamnose reductase [Solirubrobacterales bacterium]MBV9423752.1 dTDP-4-dehydrorhamnose reductase [Solirubrobacterales bacterium]
MRMLITGATGMLGQDLVAAVDQAGHEPRALSRADLDITDAPAVRRAISDAQPHVVVNCAAWTDVDGAESSSADALSVNGTGAGHVARAAAAAGAWTIQISSDYVFDGSKHEPYVESDPAAPLSAYGRSKLAGEREVAAGAPGRHTIVRSSWLFGAGGPCFPATILRLASEREELTVVEDQVGCPTFTRHLARALVTLAEQPIDGIVHLAGAGACSWYDFARQIVSNAGFDCDVKPGRTRDLARPAPRPAYSVLATERGSDAPVLPGWREGLSAYMAAGEVGAR